jgi:hypothetical protein
MEQEQLALFDDPPHAEDAPMRRALLGGRAVEFRFQRRRRRSIGIRVNEQGLSVAAPLRAPWRGARSKASCARRRPGSWKSSTSARRSARQ